MSIFDIIRRMFRKSAQPRNAAPTRFRPSLEGFEDRIVPTPVIAVQALASTVNEGDTVAYRISTDDSSNALYILYSYSGSGSSDFYSPQSMPVMIAQGSSYVDVSITPYTDLMAEGTESVTLTISSSPLSYSIGSPGSATMSIIDMDIPHVTAAKQGSDPTEGGNGTWRITRSGSTSGNLTVNFTTGGAATSGTDYTSIGTSTTITSGNSYVDVTVTTLADNFADVDENAIITLTDGGSSYSAIGATASLTIADDPVLVSIARLADGTEGGSNGAFRVSRTGGNIGGAIVLTYAVTGTASSASNADFTALSGTVTIGASASYADITITVTNNGTAESTETVILTLDSDDDFVINVDAATAFIWDNDGAFFAWDGDTDTNWMNANNWVGGTLPGSTGIAVFSGSPTYNPVLAGPLSPVTLAELRVESSFTGTITLSFPVSVGSLQMAGGTIDQPSSGYGSDLTVTGAAAWTGGVLNSTSNVANVIFDDAAVVIDASADLTIGSELLFSGVTNAIAVGGSVTTTNGQIVVIGSTAVVTFTGTTFTVASATTGAIKVDGGTAIFNTGAVSIHSLHVLNGGKAYIAGSGTLTITGNVTGYATTAVRIEGGDLNIQNGTTLNAGSNLVTVLGTTGGSARTGKLNTFASANPPGGREEATIKTSKLVVGSNSSGATAVNIGYDALRPDLPSHRYSLLTVTGAVEWVKGNYYPTVDDTVGIRDRWEASGTFKIEGSTTTVAPSGTTTANREEIVLKGSSIDAVDSKAAVLPSVSAPWDWITGVAYGQSTWKVKR